MRFNIKIISRNISVLSMKIKQFETSGFWGKYVVCALIKYFYNKLDHVVNQQHNMRNDLILLFPNLSQNSSVIYNPSQVI